MIEYGESGISCMECDHEEKATTKAGKEELVKRLEWSNGDPICPVCTHTVWFEDYIDDEAGK